MCGIAGYFGNYNKLDIQKMTDAIAHRGPDGSGVWVEGQADHVGHVALGHRRLSIIDTSDNAAQPMISSDERYVVSFNGEIYNFKELAIDLKARGYVFNEKSDTAILAPLFDAYGTEMLHKLDGIFAFAIYDRKEKSLFVARDHAGIKPLYYAQSDSGLAFCSELKGLLHLPDVARDIDGDALFSYLTYMWCPGERTLISSIKKLLPGHYITISETNEMETHCWYDPPLREKGSGKAEISHNDLLQLIDDTIEAQRISDVPLGSFLSGGVDSSAIVDSMARQKKDTIETFCIGFEGSGMQAEGFGNDSDYAKMIENSHNNVNLHNMISNYSIFDKIPEMVYHLDEPQADTAPLFVGEICKQAKSMGIKVLMNGSGADDLFSGYRRHHAIRLHEKVGVVPPALRGMLLGAASVIAPNKNLKRRINKLKYILEKDSYNGVLRSFHQAPLPMLIKLLDPDLQVAYAHKSVDHLESRLDTTQGASGLERMLDLELHGFLPDHNLNYTDKLSMAEGVEVRVPFVTKGMKEFAMQIPDEMKVDSSGAKVFLKQALQGRLPHEVLYRSKTGFGSPIRSWLMGEALPWLKDIVLSDRLENRGIFKVDEIEKLIHQTKSGVVDGAYVLFTILVMEIWFRQFLDVDTPQVEKF